MVEQEITIQKTVEQEITIQQMVEQEIIMVDPLVTTVTVGANRRRDNVLAFKRVLYGTVKGLYVKDLVTSSLWTEKKRCAEIMGIGNPAGVVIFG